jgi:hypothetical protein
LQQLFYVIGEDLFRKNIKSYFDEFKWKNTELADLIRHMQKGNTVLDLEKWKYAWIETAGTNTVEVEWDPNSQGKQVIKLKQGALLKEFPTLREHKMDLAFYKDDGELGLTKTVFMKPQEVTEVEIDNQGYKAVLPNANDWTFISVILDKQSREYFVSNLSKLQELSKLLIVRSLFNDVKQAKIKGSEFVETLAPLLESNLDNPTIVKEFGGYLSSAFHYIPDQISEPLEEAFFERIWGLIEKTEDQTILQELKGLLIGSITTGKQCQLVYETLYKKNEVGKKLSFDQRLTANIHYFTLLYSGVDEKIVEEAKAKILSESENNQNFRNRKFSMESFLMDKDAKMKLWKEEVLSSERTRSCENLIYTLLGIRTKYNSKENREHFLKEYFEQLVGFIAKEDKQIAETFIYYGLPCWEDVEYVKKQYEEVLPKVRELDNQFAIKAIMSKIENYKIQLRAYELYK